MISVRLVFFAALFSVAASAFCQVYSDQHDFGGTVSYSNGSSGMDGIYSSSSVTFDASRNMYGTTSAGGQYGVGSVWEITASGTYIDLHDFNPNDPTDGAENPNAGVTFDQSGNMFGTTLNSASGKTGGAVWKISTSGVYSVPHTFGGLVVGNFGALEPDGKQPLAGVSFDVFGNMFGTTSAGGGPGGGIVWEIDTTGQYTDLHDFGVNLSNGQNGPDGQTPQGSISFDSQGNLYGTTVTGGANSAGIVWELTPNGGYTDVHDFGGNVFNTTGVVGTDGESPVAGVTFDAAGNMYGTAESGGAYGDGIVWQIMPSGQYFDLHDFGLVQSVRGVVVSDGRLPLCTVTFDILGNMFGTTVNGGAYGNGGSGGGILWEITASGTYLDLHDFGGTITNADGSSGPDGVAPSAGVTFDNPGTHLFGTTSAGGPNGAGQGGYGSVWKLNLAGVMSLTLSPNTIAGGNTGQGTITLFEPSHVPATLTVTSNNPSAMVPQTVLVPPLTTTVTFTINTNGVDAQTVANISASLNGESQSANLTIVPAQIQSVSLLPSTVVGGNATTGSVILTGQAGPSGLTVGLASSNSAATVPSVVVVAAGQSSASFAVNTSGVSSQTTSTITGSLNGQTSPATLTIMPATLQLLTVSPVTVTGGGSSAGVVTLTGQAGPGGTMVTLASGNGAASLPATVTVAGGQNSASFTITTSGVNSQTTVTISASLSGQMVPASLTINPAQIVSIGLSPSTVAGGSTSTGTVTLNGPAGPGGAVVALTSSSEPATLLGSVTVPSGQNTATFLVSTNGVDVQTTSVITATSNGISKTATLTVTTTQLLSVILNPSTVVGGNNSTGIVMLGGPAGPSGTVVTLSSSNSAALVSNSVTVKAGRYVATFAVTTPGVSTQTSATITASFGTQSQSATLTVTPAQFLAVSVSPSSVPGGTTATGTLFMTGAAGPGGTVVTLTSSAAAASAPKTVTIPSGQATATFAVNTVAVTSNQIATMTAKCGAASDFSTLVVAAPTPVTLSFNPSTVAAGQSSTGTVTLSGPAPKGGATVNLTSSSKLATVPAAVKVSAGANSATFVVKTAGGATPQVATITARLNGASATATLTIDGPTLVSVKVSPASVVGGKSATGTVTISAAAPSGGLTLSLSSGQSAATVPESVTIPSGKTSVTFAVKTTAVGAKASATITATSGAVSESATLSILP